MLLRNLLVIFIICGSWFTSSAQKVKYKDLFNLLNAKDYETSESFLKLFLVANPDHANANMHMAFIHEFHARQKDVLLETEEYLAFADSANKHYRLAISLINEKEVKKYADKYYVAYQRRDLRTGKFGVKMSDVHLDLEGKSTALANKAEKVALMKGYFLKATTLYDSSYVQFGKLRQSYSTITDLYLSSRLSTINDLRNIRDSFDSALFYINNYLASMQKVPGSGYLQQLRLSEVLNYEVDGTTPTDFTGERINGWNLGPWANSAIVVIKNEIFPLRDASNAYDKMLHDLQKKITTDSMAYAEEVAAAEDKEIIARLSKYDDTPLPVFIADFRYSEIKLMSAMQALGKNHNPDSSDLDYQYSYLDSLSRVFEPMEPAVEKLKNVDLSVNSVRYAYFIEKRFGGRIGFIDFINKKTISTRLTGEKFANDLERLTVRRSWAIDIEDSISLVSKEITEDFFEDEHYTTGLIPFDSLAGFAYGYKYNSSDSSLYLFLAQVSKARVIENKTYVALDSSLQAQALQAQISFVGDREAGFLVCHLNGTNAIATMAIKGGITNWSGFLELAGPLQAIDIDPDTERLALMLNENPTAASNGDAPMVTIWFLDAEGNLASEKTGNQ